jgi:hypothetical protein
MAASMDTARRAMSRFGFGAAPGVAAQNARASGLFGSAGAAGVIRGFPDRLLPPGFLSGLRPRRPAEFWPSALGPVLGRLGSLEVRLATTPREVRHAQRLRFKVFCDEMSATPNGACLLSRRDHDDSDPICDHLLVLDHASTPKPFRPARPKVVGTYRLLRQDVADEHFGFYTAGEYDIAPLIETNREARFLELGRSCVLKPTATSGPLNCSGTASGPMCSIIASMS